MDIGEGLRVLEAPGKPKDCGRDLAAVRQPALQREPTLCLGDVLAGVAPQVEGGSRIAVGPQLVERESAGVGRAGIVAHVREGGQIPAPPPSPTGSCTRALTLRRSASLWSRSPS